VLPSFTTPLCASDPAIPALPDSTVASGFSFGDVNFSFSGILIDSEENIF